MISGRVTAVLTVLGLISGMTLLLGASVALAQTPDEACAADSLYLISPDAVVMRQQAVGRPGLELSWQGLSTSESTCFTLTGLSVLDFSVEIAGGFGDQVDRILAFSTGNSGTIGSQSRDPLQLNWQSQGNAGSGVLAGSINLANNGGLLKLNSGLGTWSQENNGLPMNWRQTNVTALGEGSNGFKVAAFTTGSNLDSNPAGVWIFDGSTWTRIGQDFFAPGTIFTRLAVSASNNDLFALGTSRLGLYVTSDGGQTFTNFGVDLDPDYSPLPTNFMVEALNWDSSRLFVFLTNFGLFISENNGVSFTRSEIEVDVNLDSTVVPPPMMLPGAVNDITVNPTDADHILLSLKFNGVWESEDGGQTWHDLYGDLLVVGDPDDGYSPGGWVHSALSATFDPADRQVIVAAMRGKGLYRTADGGSTWNRVGGAVQPNNLSQLTNMYLRYDPGTPGLMYVLEDGWSLLRSADAGLTWEHLASQPFLIKGRQLLVSRDGTGDLLMASYGGGIYVPGTPISLSDTYNTSTSSYLRDLDLGLDLTFDSGLVDATDTFNLVCQTFQGWAVWRAPSHNRENLTLLGLYDRVNPESCIEGYCGDVSYEIVPQCYVSKRAACFNFDTPDTIRFFDDEVYNGFSYFYAVSTFDYGNTALASPQNNTNSMIFSPRFALDSNSPFPGNGNLSYVQINSALADPATGETIYVYPNPLRRDAGIPGSEGEQVVFTNLPPQSRVRIFTTAGDDVINLGWDNMQNGNIYWGTVNRDGESVSPGVYLYKVEAPTREDHWGKVVIIR